MTIPAAMRIGFQVWGQSVSWRDLVRIAPAIERLGFDSVWANDHFYPIAGDGVELLTGHDGPVFEAWMTLGAWAGATERVRLGCLVSGAAYRNAGLLVKMATALDHASGGRAILGLGAGWHAREHDAFGYAYPGLRERLDRLAEVATIVRGLLDGDPVTFEGSWASAHGARNDPPPVQEHLPLLIGGSGERRTLPLVARLADVWNGEGDPATYGRKNAVLDELCVAAGRDPGQVARTAGLPPPCVRGTHEAAVRDLAATLARHQPSAPGALAWAAASPFAGTEEEVAEALDAYRNAGAEEVIFDLPAPFDVETLERLAGPVRDLLTSRTGDRETAGLEARR